MISKESNKETIVSLIIFDVLEQYPTDMQGIILYGIRGNWNEALLVKVFLEINVLYEPVNVVKLRTGSGN